MPDPSVPTIAVIGGGASGTLAAIHVLRQARQPVRVLLFERRAEVGQGVAYSTEDAAHRLNVPAGKMSALPDVPGHFLDWLHAGPEPPLAEATSSSFVARGLFGRYLRETLAHAAAGAAPGVHAEHLQADAADVGLDGNRAVVRVAEGQDVVADRVVVAVGHGESTSVQALRDLPDRVVVRDPWAPGALEHVRTGADVLVVGTGLTMVDVAVTLERRGVGSMVAVSRRGLVPLGHARPEMPRAETSIPEAPSPTALLGAIRSEAARTHDWRAAVDAVRRDTAARWRSFADSDKESFLRHLRPYWDVHRHRTAPEVKASVDALRASGRLRVAAGRVVRAVSAGDGAAVTVQRRGGGEEEIRVETVVLCTGSRPATGTPVVLGLVRAGEARPDRLGLGLETDDRGALVGAGGRVSERLFTLGPLRQGTLWESTAIPEIRVQAAALAAHLVDHLG